ncbi:MAG: class I SAM-dependent methyltransferase [Alphaproteobacteria bacterium]|nr:class I SAM-dependent methyltransferase [Alphaproteobacteria bacterium]
MRQRLKALFLKITRILAWPWGLVPFAARRTILRGMLLLESRIGPANMSLRHLFQVQDDIDRLFSERATNYGGGVNPKHRLTSYHDFFVERVPDGARVLDIGCGIGEVARTIAQRRPDVSVVGVDSDPAILAKGRRRAMPGNLRLIEGDATRGLPDGPWDVVVLSNVLEHIEDRSKFLQSIRKQACTARMLIRVPLFERHWHMPLRKELGIDFRSDPTHYIEHSLAEFDDEMAQAGLRIVERKTLWGEIWANCEQME